MEDSPTSSTFEQRPSTPVTIRLNDDMRELRVTDTRKREGKKGSYIVVSGGTAANDFVQAFGRDCAFVLPVSDDGGSSSEILRCLGGPSIGDIRSRLIRLIPVPENGVMDLIDEAERLKGIEAVHDLFAQRFPATSTERQAKEMWGDIIEGKSELWVGIPEDRREAMRAFFVHFNTLILRRAHKHFSFKNCSLGNVFLAAARDLLGGLPGAIFMFKALTDSQGTAEVMPIIVTNQRITIAAKLENGRVITGQCEISHPAPQSLSSTRTSRSVSYTNVRKRSDSMSFDTAHMSSYSDDDYDSTDSESTATVEDHEPTASEFDTQSGSELSFRPRRAMPGSPWRDPIHLKEEGPPENSRVDAEALGESLRNVARKQRQQTDSRHSRTPQKAGEQEQASSNALYVKGSQEVPLESRIERLYYIENAYGHEIFPDPNSEMIKQLQLKETLVYSCGSLWTSIIPCLALRGVASTIARSTSLRHKVLLLNFKNDRETDGYTAIDYVNAIVSSLNRHNKPRKGDGRATRQYQIRQLLTHLVYLEGGKVNVHVGALEACGITVIKVPASAGTKFTKDTVEWALSQLP